MRTSFFRFVKPLCFFRTANIIACCFLISIPNLSGQYFQEDFENGMPEQWTKTGLYSGGLFSVKPSASFNNYYFPVSEHTQVVGLNHPQNNYDAVERLVTGVIDLSSAPNTLVLKMRSNFLSLSGKSTARILISEDGGNEWSMLHELKSKGYWSDLAIKMVYGGKKIQLAFEYEEYERVGHGWVVDDIVIDDFVPLNDVAVVGWNEEPFFKGGFEGVEIRPGVVIKNNGSEVVNSIDFTYDANGQKYSETFDELNLEPLESMLIEAKVPQLLGPDSLIISNPRIANVNSNGEDDNYENDVLKDTFTVTTVTPHPDKGVLVEETGGTWCEWSPRGYIYMKGMSRRYPNHFVDVSVHNDDDMMVEEYDSVIRRRVQHWPTVFVERRTKLDPKKIEMPFMDAVTKAPVAKLDLGGAYDSGTKELSVSLKAKFLSSTQEQYKLGGILVEDGVTGVENTVLGYIQLNAYAGGELGPMGGYEVLPAVVPSTTETFDGVARELIGGFEGDENSLPLEIKVGEEFVHNFTPITIPDGVDLEKVRVIGVIYGERGLYTEEYVQPSNAIESTFSDLIENGVFEQIDRSASNDIDVSINPNPMVDFAQIKITTTKAEQSTLEIYDARGRLISKRGFGDIAGLYQFEYDAMDIPSGTYLFRFRIGSDYITKKVIVAKND